MKKKIWSCWKFLLFWFWWYLKATDEQKADWQLRHYGMSVKKGVKFIDIKKLIKPSK